MNKIDVFIADDQKMMREALSLLLNNQPEFEVVGETFKHEEIVEGLKNLKPDVLLLDPDLVDLYDVHSISSYHRMSPETKIIMLSNQSRDGSVHRALNEGAKGYIVKQSPSSEVAEAIRQVMAGNYYLSPKIKNMVVETYIEGSRTKPRRKSNEQFKYRGYNQLSEREKEVFLLLLEGRSSKEISASLEISPKTADKHRTSIFKKTGVENATQLLHYAIRLGLMPHPQDVLNHDIGAL